MQNENKIRLQEGQGSAPTFMSEIFARAENFVGATGGYDKWGKRMAMFLKIMVTLYTVTHASHALGIQDGEWTLIFGLIAIEAGFLYAGFLLTEGLVKGRGQTGLAWGVVFMAVGIMAANSVLAVAERSGSAIPSQLEFYKVFLLPTSPIFMAIALVGVFFLSPDAIAGRQQTNARLKTEQQERLARLERLNLQAEKNRLAVESEIAVLKSEARMAGIKNQQLLRSERRKVRLERIKAFFDATIDIRIMGDNVLTKMKAARLTRQSMRQQLSSRRFSDQLKSQAQVKAGEVVDSLAN